MHYFYKLHFTFWIFLGSHWDFGDNVYWKPSITSLGLEYRKVLDPVRTTGNQPAGQAKKRPRISQKTACLPKFKRKTLAGRKFKGNNHRSRWVEKNVETAAYSRGWTGKVTSARFAISLMSLYPIKIVLSLAHFDIFIKMSLESS